MNVTAVIMEILACQFLTVVSLLWGWNQYYLCTFEKYPISNKHTLLLYCSQLQFPYFTAVWCHRYFSPFEYPNV